MAQIPAIGVSAIAQESAAGSAQGVDVDEVLDDLRIGSDEILDRFAFETQEISGQNLDWASRFPFSRL